MPANDLPVFEKTPSPVRCADEKGEHCSPVGNYVKIISDFKCYYE